MITESHKAAPSYDPSGKTFLNAMAVVKAGTGCQTHDVKEKKKKKESLCIIYLIRNLPLVRCRS